MSRILLMLVVSAFASTVHAQEKIDLKKIDLMSKGPSGKVFKIEDGEANFNGQMVKRVELGTATAIITYLNKTGAAKAPLFSFRVMNAYGIQIGSFHELWVTSIAAGDTKKQNAQVHLYPVENVLEFSDVAIPKDWDKAVYLMTRETP